MRDIAAEDECRGRGLDLGEQAGIVRLVEEEVACAVSRGGGHFAFGEGGVCDSRRASAAALGKHRERVDRGVGAAEAGDELAIGDRSDPGRADEPKS